MENPPIVRIQQIELKNFKNVEHGIVIMPSSLKKEHFSYSADILGIYGQNGTGKTAVVESMEIIKELLQGQPLPKETTNYISKNHDTCSICVTFTVENKIMQAQVEYSVDIKQDKNDKNQCIIDFERIKFAPWDGNKFSKLKEFITFSSDKVAQFTPNSRYKNFVQIINKIIETSSQTDSNILEGKIQIATNTLMAQKERRSAIFELKNQDLFNKIVQFSSNTQTVNDSPISLFEMTAMLSLVTLLSYSFQGLSIVSNILSGLINTKKALPLTCVEEKSARQGYTFLPLEESFVVHPLIYDIIKKSIKTINIVMPKIVPNILLEIKEIGKEIQEDSTEGIRIQILSRRGDTLMPLGFESAGIIKIISLINTLVHVYNNPSSCLIVDELDSGIFEYLLGELLSIFEKNAQGQIIFTSHNLRPLEMLDKSNIIFSTTNPKNRYTRVKNIKNNNNLRDVYFRLIQLGGEQEELYMETDSIEIARAFRKASKVENSKVEDNGEI